MLSVKAGPAVALAILLVASAWQAVPPVAGAASGRGPASLAVSVIPQALPADSHAYPSVVISLVDANGAPTFSLTDTLIYLSSTNASVASVPSTVTLAAGHAYVLVNVTTGGSAGTTTLTAASSGLASKSVSVDTVVPSSGAQGLGLFVSPSQTLLALGGKDLVYAVELQGANGQPAISSSATSVIITSSNNDVIGKPISVSIPSGTSVIYGQMAVNATGTATLTALASGLKTATAQVSVASSSPSLSLTASPSTITTSTASSVTVAVQVLGMPVPGASVVLSSNGGTISPAQLVTNAGGQGSVEFLPDAPGVFTIRAVATYPSIGLNVSGTEVIVVSAATTTATGTLDLLTPITPYLPVLVVVIVIVVAVLLVRRAIGRRKGTSDEDELVTEAADEQQTQ